MATQVIDIDYNGSTFTYTTVNAAGQMVEASSLRVVLGDDLVWRAAPGSQTGGFTVRFPKTSPSSVSKGAQSPGGAATAPLRVNNLGSGQGMKYEVKLRGKQVKDDPEIRVGGPPQYDEGVVDILLWVEREYAFTAEHSAVVEEGNWVRWNVRSGRYPGRGSILFPPAYSPFAPPEPPPVILTVGASGLTPSVRLGELRSGRAEKFNYVARLSSIRRPHVGVRTFKTNLIVVPMPRPPAHDALSR